MTLEAYRKKLQTSGQGKETTTEVQHNQEVLRSCVDWDRFSSALQTCKLCHSCEKGGSQAKHALSKSCQMFCNVLSIQKAVGPDGTQAQMNYTEVEDLESLPVIQQRVLHGLVAFEPAKEGPPLSNCRLDFKMLEEFHNDA
ncbi:hypothetical protein BTVI_30462 [Pitangus sulphuratus]|nr:hypothetical protein BTVI_30462 [Pitangus sulphuratus]